jgi:hypothetical protein
MAMISQQLRPPQDERPPFIPWQGSAILRFASALVLAGGLALAPVPAFAQHGGGGGGGSHGGGGGGGASHGSFGGGGGSAPASSSGGGSHASGGSSGNNGGGSSGGHWWNPFHSSSAASAPPARGANSVAAGNIKSESSATATSGRLAAGNNTWLEPPSASARAAARVNYYGPANVNVSRPFVPLSTSTRAPLTSAHGAAVVAAAQHPFQPVRPGYPYYPYYPYFGYYPYFAGFGFGWGGFGPCDPFWGCYGYGFGYGFGGGLGYFGGLGSYGGYSIGYGSGWTDASSEASANVTSPDNVNSYLYAAPGTGGAQAADSSDAAQAAPAGSAPQQTYVLLYLKDGSSFAVSDYWLTGGKLHYVTSYGGDNAVDESQIDLQRTVNENAARGVDFSLRPLPAAAGDAAAPAQNPEPQKR